MGLLILGNLLPQELTQQQWEQAYEESLQLVKAYDFLDIIHDKEKYAKYGLVWAYAEKSKERSRRASWREHSWGLCGVHQSRRP